MPKDGTPLSIELESAKVKFLQEMVERHGLGDVGKAVRCLINYARDNPARQADIFDEVRCQDC
jgi:hypothetical protein